ncbi:class D sortase [bacterium]|nr:class D sortase [bacterium]
MRKYTAILLIVFGLFLLADPFYFYARGMLRQFQLRQVWAASLDSGKQSVGKYASQGTPVARLMIPALDMDNIVLQGTDKETLALGPGLTASSVVPGEFGNVVIAGHRDSFFQALQFIRKGDAIALETAMGTKYYTVYLTDVIEPYDTEWTEQTGDAYITLITCYPFEYIGPAPLRFVIRGQQAE